MKKIFLLVAVLFVFTSCSRRVIVTQPTTKTIVIKRLPQKHTIVNVKGHRYYKWNGNLYRKTRRGYVLTRI